MQSHDHHPGATAANRDPVCGMTVDLTKTAHKLTHEGREIGFCSAGCKAKFEAEPQKYLTAIDPVCGMSVDRATAAHMLKHEGTRYYFCSAGCLESFGADPGKYLNAVPFALPGRGSATGAAPSTAFGGPPPPSSTGEDQRRHDLATHDHVQHGRGYGPTDAVVPAGTTWTCPMHPEIVRDGPGDCPICGMALEPMVASLDDGPNPELVDFTRRLWVSVLFSVPILVLAMGDMLGLGIRARIGELAGAGAGKPGGAVGGVAVRPALYCIAEEPLAQSR